MSEITCSSLSVWEEEIDVYLTQAAIWRMLLFSQSYSGSFYQPLCKFEAVKALYVLFPPPSAKPFSAMLRQGRDTYIWKGMLCESFQFLNSNNNN